MADELLGVADFTRKLNKLDGKLQVKAFRSVLFKATSPVVRKMKARIPVGTEAHRTYKGRLVVPTFAKRSIKRLTGKKFLNQGRLSIAIGVKAEALYSILYDQGPYIISTRRQQTSIKARGHAGTQRRRVLIKPYTLKYKPWFENTFKQSQNQMLLDIKSNLKLQVERIARG